MKNQKGFTIIELIVVIAIIAILASIVMVNVAQYINKAKDAAVKSSMAKIAQVEANYFSDNGVYTVMWENDAQLSRIKDFVTAESGVTLTGATNQDSTCYGFCEVYPSDNSKTWCV